MSGKKNVMRFFFHLSSRMKKFTRKMFLFVCRAKWKIHVFFHVCKSENMKWRNEFCEKKNLNSEKWALISAWKTFCRLFHTHTKILMKNVFSSLDSTSEHLLKYAYKMEHQKIKIWLAPRGFYISSHCVSKNEGGREKCLTYSTETDIKSDSLLWWRYDSTCEYKRDCRWSAAAALLDASVRSVGHTAALTC